jgi:hypothetical protein
MQRQRPRKGTFPPSCPSPRPAGRCRAQRDGGGLLFPIAYCLLPIAFFSQDTPPTRLRRPTSPRGAGRSKSKPNLSFHPLQKKSRAGGDIPARPRCCRRSSTSATTRIRVSSLPSTHPTRNICLGKITRSNPHTHAYGSSSKADSSMPLEQTQHKPIA